MKRKDTLRNLLGGGATTEPAPSSPTARVPSGAVRAMGLNLGHLRDEAESLRAQLEAGAAVVDLDPADIDSSFIQDRIAADNDVELQALVQSIQEAGQQVPVLVRPHPDIPGRYQMAYGHRRLIAVRRLGFKLKAVIRPLTDAELVVAQGKENIERRNLTFIERALFAAHLEQHGFDRPTLHAALAVQSAEMTRYLQVVRAIPRTVILAIGAAPRTGRPRWLELQRLFTHPQAESLARRAMDAPGFRALNSDARFQRIHDALRQSTSEEDAERYWRNPKGDPVVRIEASGLTTRLTINEKLEPHFARFLVNRLDALHREFQADQEG
ncbi:plasmid partitioning protein RepB [Teichococcus oryzae]|uniref:Plasmid partitioning protein RepB n=1 Tax=Teichococcus oryzae TaxID=1608942 RepID=A0A5B2TEB1_9PROT|nr:plasmid partitioning protein RepB [Pseudoroseomonas oryzae]KAA2212453.1 plasmid partitioning protein RepB [Pseudoroseomonas oryzae]